jgi:hypothetical protein
MELGSLQIRRTGNPRTVHSLFEKQVRSCPNAPAVYRPDAIAGRMRA